MNVSGALPAYLSIPASSTPAPPTETRVQKLPYAELRWEDFERLCLRLAREEAEIEKCRSYGKQGSTQRGIDLFGRRKMAEKFVVFQCKNEASFGPQKIKDAVTAFLEGEWAPKTERFVLCMRESASKTGREEAIEEQRQILQTKDIEFEPWDGAELDLMLKNHPGIVIDFFGRIWAERFNGVDETRQFQSRLDSNEVQTYREQLGSLYQTLFNLHDPGLRRTGHNSDSPLPIESRFVLPDVILPPEFASFASAQTSQQQSERVTNEGPRSENLEASNTLRRSPLTVERRTSIVSALTTNHRFVVLGGPGSGKSTSLRFIAIDLLSEVPREAELAQKWGTFLPIWIPFAFWTKQVAGDQVSPPSLPEVIRRWLEANDELRLWPLIDRALNDERLLLLVDGLDEWVNEAAARIALDLLQAFVQRRKLSAIVASRHLGFQRLGMATTGWTVVDIAGFSAQQQSLYVENWLRHWGYGDANSGRIQHAIDEFIGELGGSGDLSELASVPLLLGILLLNHLRGVQLPSTRFRAYEQLIDDLVDIQPKQRARAAFVPKTPSISPQHLISMSAFLAYKMQSSDAGGTLGIRNAEMLLRSYLQDADGAFGLTPFESIEWARDYLAAATDSAGLLVRVAPDVLGFFHPALNEFLVAKYLSTRDGSELSSLIEARRSDPRWREILVGLLQLTRQQAEVERLVNVLRLPSKNAIDRVAVESILDEVAFGDFMISARCARELAEDAINRIELGTWSHHRKNTLRLAITGLRSSKTSETIRDRLESWLPGRSIWRPGLYKAMANWPRSAAARACLERGIHCESVHDQRAAARSLTSHIDEDHATFSHFRNVMATCHRSSTVAAFLELLLSKWSGDHRIDQLIETGCASTIPQVRFLCRRESMRRNRLDDETFEDLLSLSLARVSVLTSITAKNFKQR